MAHECGASRRRKERRQGRAHFRFPFSRAFCPFSSHSSLFNPSVSAYLPEPQVGPRPERAAVGEREASGAAPAASVKLEELWRGRHPLPHVLRWKREKENSRGGKGARLEQTHKKTNLMGRCAKASFQSEFLCVHPSTRTFFRMTPSGDVRNTSSRSATKVLARLNRVSASSPASPGLVCRPPGTPLVSAAHHRSKPKPSAP